MIIHSITKQRSKKKFKKIFAIIRVEKREEKKIMINIRSIKKLNENEGLTLKHGKPITYKTGYQVATEGIATTDAREAINTVKEYEGNCGVWFSEGIYYVDRSHRESTKRSAEPTNKSASSIGET